MTKAKGVEGAKGKEAKTLSETKALKASRGKEAVPKAKESEPVKPQVVAQEKKAFSGKASDPSIS